MTCKQLTNKLQQLNQGLKIEFVYTLLGMCKRSISGYEKTRKQLRV